MILLNEYRHNKVEASLRARLTGAGYACQAAPHAEPKKSIAFVASRKPFEAVTFPGQLNDPELGDLTTRVLLARLSDLNVFCVFMPSMEQKRPVFDFLLKLPERYRLEDSVLMGDLNTGRHHEDEAGATFVSAHQFDALLDQGWIDACLTKGVDLKWTVTELSIGTMSSLDSEQ